jgi:hypothetical protein
VADAAPDISIVIPSWNGRELLAASLASVRQTRGDLRLQLIVVDNASSDGSVRLVRARFPEVAVLENQRNEGFARACNQGALASAAPFLLLLNSDTEVRPQALQRLLALARARPEAAIVGPQLRNPDGTFQSSHSPFPDLWQEAMILSGAGRLLHGAAYPSRGAEEAKGPQPADWVGGACMLVRRAAFAAAGGFDEGYFMYAEEMDLCYRLRCAGWEVWYEPAAVVVHAGGGSARQLGTQSEAILYRSRIRFYRCHRGVAAARLVRWMVLGATAIRIGVHGLLRAASGGRRGRRVVSLRQLQAALREV